MSLIGLRLRTAPMIAKMLRKTPMVLKLIHELKSSGLLWRKHKLICKLEREKSEHSCISWALHEEHLEDDHNTKTHYYEVARLGEALIKRLVRTGKSGNAQTFSPYKQTYKSSHFHMEWTDEENKSLWETGRDECRKGIRTRKLTLSERRSELLYIV